MGESAGESVSRTALITTGVETPQRSSTLVEWLVQSIHQLTGQFTVSPIHQFTISRRARSAHIAFSL
jgi:hypothetical protein